MVLAPLQFSGRSLVPDVLGGIQQGQQVSQGRNILEQQRLGIQGTQQEQALRQQQAEQAAVLQQQAQDLLARSQAGEKGVATGTEIGQILLKDNKLGKNLRDVIGLNTEAKKLRAAKFGRALEQAVGDIPAQNRIIQQNIVDVEAGGGDASHSKELLTLPEDRRLKAARLFQLNALNRDELAGLVTEGLKGGKQGLASAVTRVLDDGSAIQALPTGDVVVRNPAGQVVTGQERIDTLRRASESKLKTTKKLAEIEIETARAVAGVKNREKRISDKKTEFSTRIQGSAREGVRLNAALNAAAKADQGLTGSLKLQLAKVFPDIDVTSEAALDQALGQLTIDQLQKFKGPTTDFEFAKSQLTVGALGDSKTANVSRLKALQRNSWFVTRESEQFNKHIKNGGDVDNFAFNFNELIKTKRGNFTLRQLQDTAADANISIEETLKRLN